MMAARLGVERHSYECRKSVVTFAFKSQQGPQFSIRSEVSVLG